MLNGEENSSVSGPSTTGEAKTAAQDAGRPEKSNSSKNNETANDVKDVKRRLDVGALFSGTKNGKSQSCLASKTKDATAGKGSEAKRKEKATSEPIHRYRRLRRIQKAKGR